MKPLELTIYPIWDAGDGTLYADHPARQWPTNVGYEVYRKRLTDAELAAEFEAARCDYLLSQASGHFWAPLGETWPSDHKSAGRRTTTLLRFATLPHYDEDQS